MEEIPDLIKFTKKYKKEKASLYLVSLDMEDYYPEKIKKFVAKKNMIFFKGHEVAYGIF